MGFSMRSPGPLFFLLPRLHDFPLDSGIEERYQTMPHLREELRRPSYSRLSRRTREGVPVPPVSTAVIHVTYHAVSAILKFIGH